MEANPPLPSAPVAVVDTPGAAALVVAGRIKRESGLPSARVSGVAEGVSDSGSDSGRVGDDPSTAEMGVRLSSRSICPFVRFTLEYFERTAPIPTDGAERTGFSQF